VSAMFAKVSTALLVVALSANQALAACVPWLPCPGGGGASVPEIDGTAGIMALALVASVAGLLYNRARK
jgi:hypothetical protein